MDCNKTTSSAEIQNRRRYSQCFRLAIFKISRKPNSKKWKHHVYNKNRSFISDLPILSCSPLLKCLQVSTLDGRLTLYVCCRFVHLFSHSPCLLHLFLFPLRYGRKEPGLSFSPTFAVDDINLIVLLAGSYSKFAELSSFNTHVVGVSHDIHCNTHLLYLVLLSVNYCCSAH